MKFCRMKRKIAGGLAAAVTLTSLTMPTTLAAPQQESEYSFWILDEDEEYEEDEWEEATPGNAGKATPGNATPGNAAPGNGMAGGSLASVSDAEAGTDGIEAALRSFNQTFSFVNVEGELDEGDDPSIPETASSFPYLSQTRERTKGGIDLADYGYEEKEYFLSGTANSYQDTEMGLATVSNAEYVDRVLVFRPEDEADFNGAVYVEILNASSYVDLPDIWRRSYDFFMREGCIYVGVTSKEGNVNSLKRFDENRYQALEWPDNGVIWDILGQLGSALKRGETPILYGSQRAEACYLIGQSQSGFYVSGFSDSFGAANYLAEKETEELEAGEELGSTEELEHIYDGILNVVGGMAKIGADGTADYSKAFQPVQASEIPFILLVGENDYNPSAAREDSDEPGDLYRQYVIAGGPHSSKIFAPDMTDPIQLRAGRPAGDYVGFQIDKATGRLNTNTDFDMDVFVNAALKHLDQWAREGVAAPYGPSTEEIEGELISSGFFSLFQPERDEYGNMTTGIRSPQITVPVGAYYGGANGSYSTDGGSMVYFDEETLKNQYGSRENYLIQYETALSQMVEEGWILEEDWDRMMAHALEEPVLGQPGKDNQEIERSMNGEVQSRIIRREEKTAGKTAYTETQYLVKGEANLYGLTRGTTLYRRRNYSMPYSNGLTVCVPESFRDQIVLDLVFEGEEKRDISDYMEAGVAYVSITADPKAAEALGGSWKIMKYAQVPANPSDTKKGSQDEPGLVWDIISQTAAMLEKGGLEGLSPKQGISITLGADKADEDMVFTYQTLFKDFPGFRIKPMKLGSDAELIALNSMDAAADWRAETGIGPWTDEDGETPENPGEPETPENPGEPETPENPGEAETPAASIEPSGSRGGKSRSTSAAKALGSWVRDQNGWRFQKTDQTFPAGQWLELDWNGDRSWYYFKENGYMASGWLQLNGTWFYLHPLSDGSQGYMYTGWHQIDGKWYYFHQISDGTRGHLLTNTTTPDGWSVGADGAWIP